MGITFLSPNTLENIQYFKFKNYEDSVIKQFVLSPIISKCCEYSTNKTIEPNLITLLSFLFFIISFIITAIDSHGDFTLKLSSSTCYIQASAYLLSFLLDTVNDIQIKRIGSYNPCGVILMREISVFKLIILSYNYHHLLLLGNSNIFSLMIYISLYLGYYASINEEFLFQEISVWYYKGSSDSILILAIMSLITGISDDYYFWKYKWKLLLSQWITISIFILSMTGIVYSFINIIRIKKLNGFIYFCMNWIKLLNVYFVPLITLYFNSDFFQKYLWLLILSLSLLFAIVTIDLQLRVYLNFNTSFELYWIIANVLFLCSIFIRKEKISLLIMISISLILGTELMWVIVIRWIEISRFFQVKYCLLSSKSK